VTLKEFTVRHATNGLILKDHEENEILYQSDCDESDILQFAGFLNSLIENYFYFDKAVYEYFRVMLSL
jgi:hypothetical protein